MSISKIKTGSITADAVSTSKIATDAITEAKIADNAISEEHLDATVITGNTELAEAAAGTDVLLVYDASAGTLKKIQASNVGLQAPSVTSVSPTSVLSGDGTGNYTFTITGSGYIASAVPTLITNGGASVSFDSFTIDSSTQITAVIAKSSLTHANEPYDVRVTTAGALSSTLENQINVDASPIFNTASGSVGVFSEQSTISTIDIEAYDPDSAGNVTFELQSGSLPAGLSASTVHENGVSKYRITGTLTTDQTSFTTTNFTLRAVDAASNTSSRAFSISEVPSGVQSFTSSGTFSVPTGITTVDVLVVAGGGSGGSEHGSTGNGGGGAGGLLFVPSFSVTPGGTVSVTVGCGGAGIPDSQSAQGNDGQDSVFGTLTAKGGGGGGGTPSDGRAGGSGGGGGGPCGAAGSANQPTQPGQSGAYGFGSNGGSGGNPFGTPLFGAGGGGGGAGGAGTNGQPSPAGGDGGPGGDGRAYTIADGTTPVYYAGGGGGSASNVPGAAQGSGGQGGGSPGQDSAPTSPGGANKGGGTGGARAALATGTGGKGIVIVRY
jgi:hypothetical protein